MNIEQEIQNILDRNFTRGDNAKALKELLVLYNVVRPNLTDKHPIEGVNQTVQTETDHKEKQLFCDTCKSEVTYWADLDRWTCNCGRKIKAK
jgi:hypothetical protein